jgi:hypothetical protein
VARARIPVGGFGTFGVAAAKGPDGNYRAWVSVRERNGKIKILNVFAPTKAKAETRLRARVEEWQRLGNILSGVPTVEGLLNAWLASRTVTTLTAEGDVSSQTLASYDYLTRNGAPGLCSQSHRQPKDLILTFPSQPVDPAQD